MELAELLTALQKSRVIPVVTVERLEDADPLADALIAGGIRAVEITLRSAVAREVITHIIQSHPQLLVGVGTLLELEHVAWAAQSGAHFAVSPGFSERLVTDALAQGLHYFPGIATVSEIMAAREMGVRCLKMFPAESVGGVGFLKGLAPIFPDCQFIPTGGITPDTLPGYLALPSVVAVGGSWIAPTTLIAEKNWAVVTRLARQAMEGGK